MLTISEILPNPAGKDSGAEFVELVAEGSPEALALYRLENGAGRGMPLPARILTVGEKFVVRPTFTVRNENETIFLRRSGNITDTAQLSGTAPEGRSFNRLGEFFLLGEPTPGLPNRPAGLELLKNPYPPGVLNADAGASFLPMLLLAGAILTAYGMLILVHAIPREHHPLH